MGEIWVSKFHERMLQKLEKLHVIENQEGNLRKVQKAKMQQDILKAMEGISWW